MNTVRFRWHLVIVCFALCTSPFVLRADSVSGAEPAAGEIRLLVRADDAGICQAVNEGCVEACTKGLARSVEVIVPGPWFLDAVKRLNDAESIDVGVHLCLTSEWERIKWRPLTGGASLTDENGHFFPMTRQRSDFPPRTGFLDNRPKLEEAERELRAQIELAKKHLKRLTHLSAHMGAATATPELRRLTDRLADEYKLPIRVADLKSVRGIGDPKLSAREKEAGLVKLLETLEPGNWLMVEHPATDTAESRSLGHVGYTNVAQDRDGVRQALTSERALRIVKARGIKLVSYGELIRETAGKQPKRQRP